MFFDDYALNLFIEFNIWQSTQELPKQTYFSQQAQALLSQQAH